MLGTEKDRTETISSKWFLYGLLFPPELMDSMGAFIEKNLDLLS
jgi:hypothetical protein